MQRLEHLARQRNCNYETLRRFLFHTRFPRSFPFLVSGSYDLDLLHNHLSFRHKDSGVVLRRTDSQDEHHVSSGDLVRFQQWLPPLTLMTQLCEFLIPLHVILGCFRVGGFRINAWCFGRNDVIPITWNARNSSNENQLRLHSGGLNSQHYRV
jgi:hypothetical protein